MFFDAPKAFDRISLCTATLLKELIAGHTPLLLDRNLMFW